MHDGYFEGVFQLRNPTDEVIEFILGEMRRKKTVLITKQKKVGDGMDIYMTDQHFMQSLGKKLSQRFCGELKISQKIFTRDRQTSKDVYRVNVFFRYIPLKVGDLTELRGEQVRIMKLGKKVTVKNIKSGKNSFVDFNDFRDQQSEADDS